jgi:glc operon protein GlcG
MAENPYLSFEQVRAAMNAMTEKALELPNEPVAMAIVDDTGNMVAYAKMDNLRMFSRRHAIRKAYTSAMMGQDSGAHGDNVRAGGRIVADMGDSMLTPNQGGLVIRKDGVILGGIGVGGYPSGQRDEDLARVGLDAMNL